MKCDSRNFICDNCEGHSRDYRIRGICGVCGKEGRVFMKPLAGRKSVRFEAPDWMTTEKWSKGVCRKTGNAVNRCTTHLWYRFEIVHSVSGASGGAAVREQCRKWNEEGYEPDMSNAKVRLFREMGSDKLRPGGSEKQCQLPR